MTYRELYESAINKLEKSEITLGEFEKMIEPLNAKVVTEINVGDKDTISRKAAITALSNEIVKRRLLDEMYDGCIDEFQTEEILKKLPSAQPQHIRGHWIYDGKWSKGDAMGESYGHYWKCDKCGYVERVGWGECGCNFCSNCGSDNREVTT